MKNLLSILLIFSTFSCFAQNDDANKNFSVAFKNLEMAQTETAFLNVIEKFDAASKKSPQNWIPKYYSALSRVFLVTSTSFKQFNTRDSHLQEAIQSCNEALKLSKDEEIYILKLYIDILKLSFSPKGNFEKYNASIQTQMENIRTLNGSNPRLFLLEAMYTFYLPEDRGEKSRARDLFTDAKAMLTNPQATTYMFQPTWGGHIADDFLKRIPF